MAVTIYTDRCKGVNECPGNGLCLSVCSLDAIENIGGRPNILEEVCVECELCVTNCPNEALSVN